MAASDRRAAPWPRISVITPSLNQGQFVEAAIRSVLLQGYPDLEYFILDGGSTDRTVEIIERYAPWLTGWQSRPDGGQGDAVNQGLRQASGEFVCWVNSDDLLCRSALARHARRMGFERELVYVGKCIRIDERGRYLFTHQGRIRSLEQLLRLQTVWRAGRHIVQPEVMFPRQLALRVGGLDAANHRTMDYDLWGRFLLAGASFVNTEILFGMSRRHPAQKTHDRLEQTESLAETARGLLGRAPDLTEALRGEIAREIDACLEAHRHGAPEVPGRLDRLGLPLPLVGVLRGIRRWWGARCSGSF